MSETNVGVMCGDSGEGNLLEFFQGESKASDCSFEQFFLKKEIILFKGVMSFYVF